MHCVAISDTHGDHRELSLAGGDLLIHAGDFTHADDPSEVVDFVDWFSAQPFRYKVLIAGNHDKLLEQQQGAMHQLISEAGVIYLLDSGCELEGIKLWGSPFTPRFFDWAFMDERGADMRAHWDKIPPDTDLLVTHGPPLGIMDEVTYQGRREAVGCEELLLAVERTRPRVHVFGHIHEGAGQRFVGGTRFVNASTMNEHYRIEHPPVQFELTPSVTAK